MRRRKQRWERVPPGNRWRFRYNGLWAEEDETYMGRLKILASGNSPQAQAQARGKLFEKLMADVLRHCGYSIDRIPSVNYAGMEVDIEGRAIATGIPLYA